MITSLLYAFAVIGSAAPVTYTFKTVDGLALEADVHVPPSTIGSLSLEEDSHNPPRASPFSKHPVLFVIHGGGFIFGTKSYTLGSQELNETLSRGWFMVSVNYRLGPDALLPDMIQDISDAYAWVRTNLSEIYPIDKDAIAVLGQSAGGGLAMMCGFLLNPAPKAIVSFYGFYANSSYGFYDPTTPFSDALAKEVDSLRTPTAEYPVKGYTDPRVLFFRNMVQSVKLGWMLASKDQNEDPQKIQATLKRFSAVDHLNSSYPPTYLCHGLADSLVPHSVSEEMATALKANKVRYVLNLAPDQEHGFDRHNDTNTEIWNNHILPGFDFIEEALASKATNSSTFFVSNEL